MQDSAKGASTYDQTWVQIDLPEGMPVLLEVFGRLTWSQKQAPGSGSQYLEIPAQAMATGTIGFYRIRTAAGVAAGKLVRE